MGAAAKTNGQNSYPEDDSHFADYIVTSVRETEHGFEIETDHGWWLHVSKPCPLKPTIGMDARYYGFGIGSPVRGVFIDGVRFFYWTETEYREKSQIEQYGANCTELLARWDEGKSVWSVTMGGLSPGYEQAIQLTAFEILRFLVAEAPDAEKDFQGEAWKALNGKIEARLADIANLLGLSGAQWGAAANLASMFYRHGPVKAMESANHERRILVSKNMPSLGKDGWLIELADSPAKAPLFWAGHGTWSPDRKQAVAFTRGIDANRVADREPLGKGGKQHRIVKHEVEVMP